MKKMILTMVAVTVIATSAFAQGFSGFQIHAGVALPTGDFASDSESKRPEKGHGHAATGFNFGFKY
jgi:hypothetical protein